MTGAAPKLLTNTQLAELTAEDRDFFQNLIHDLAGIMLTPQKADLITSRLRPHLHRLNLQSFTEYRELLRAKPRTDPEFTTFVNLLTTNKTNFFRESPHYEKLTTEIIPALLATRRGDQKLRIWCAACSTGEEAYSLAMTLESAFGGTLEFSIVGSDIDTDVLATAANGVYPLGQLAEIPGHYRAAYTQAGKDNAQGWFKIKDAVHRRIRFMNYNLLSPDPIVPVPFDVIFCRNVLIYFSQQALRRCVENLAQHLKPKGFLVIGHSESIHNYKHLFSKEESSIFRKN